MAQHTDFSEPKYLPGHKLQAHHQGGIDNIRIVAARPMGVHRHDWLTDGALTAGTLASGRECNHLKVFDGEIACYRYVVADNMLVMPKHPAASPYYQSKSFSTAQGNRWAMERWEADRSLAPVIQEYLFAASEIWVWQDEVPTWDLLPMLSQSNAVQGYCDFFGWRYAWEPMNAIEEKPVAHEWFDTWPDRGKRYF